MSGGKYRKHALKQDIQLVISALEETIEFAGVHDSIRPYYQTTFGEDEG